MAYTNAMSTTPKIRPVRAAPADRLDPVTPKPKLNRAAPAPKNTKNPVPSASATSLRVPSVIATPPPVSDASNVRFWQSWRGAYGSSGVAVSDTPVRRRDARSDEPAGHDHRHALAPEPLGVLPQERQPHGRRRLHIQTL